VQHVLSCSVCCGGHFRATSVVVDEVVTDLGDDSLDLPLVGRTDGRQAGRSSISTRNWAGADTTSRALADRRWRT
jgi:hypothetical protein